LLLRADAGQALKVDFSGDAVGTEPKAFLSVVGIWRIEAEGDKKVLAVDGRQWKEGQTAVGIADKARALYGDRYAEFLDRVQEFCLTLSPTAITSQSVPTRWKTISFCGSSRRASDLP
jgi:hypothetical protein